MPDEQRIQINPANLSETVTRKHLGILALERLAGLSGVMRGRLFTERLVRKTQDGTLGQATSSPEDQELEDMQLSVGDNVRVEMPPQQRSGAGMVPLAATAIMAALGGAMLPTLLAPGPAVQPESPAVVLPADPSPDYDTRYDLRASKTPPE